MSVTYAPSPEMFTPEGRAARESRIQAQLDSEECVARCMHCPDFHVTGTSAEVIRAQVEHRETFHKPAPAPKPKKKAKLRPTRAAYYKSREQMAQERRDGFKKGIRALLQRGATSRLDLVAAMNTAPRGLDRALIEMQASGEIRAGKQGRAVTYELVA
jgi:hypothetical protein